MNTINECQKHIHFIRVHAKIMSNNVLLEPLLLVSRRNEMKRKPKRANDKIPVKERTTFQQHLRKFDKYSIHFWNV